MIQGSSHIQASRSRRPASAPTSPSAPSSSREGRSRNALPSTSDRVEFTASDLTADRRVPVLITLPSSPKAPASDAEETPSQRDCQGVACPYLPREERLELPLINGFSTYVEPDRLDQLTSFLPAGTQVTLNHAIRYPVLSQFMVGDELALEGTQGGRVERLPNIEKVWDKGFRGQGQRIVIIDSGIHPHPDLKDKVVEWVDFSKAKKSNPVDDYGHGTHVAGIAAGSGASSQGEISGIAPDAELVGLRITTVAEAIKALQWCVENKDALNLKVVNMSLGEVARRGHKFDPWALAVEKATEAGLIVCVAAGNEGPNPGSISTPGIHPNAITVGAYDSKGTPDPSDDTVWKNSSQGPTIDGLMKPDVLAPGVAIFGPLAPGTPLDNPALPHRGQDYFAISGTSQATPMIAGLTAILLQANPALDAQGIKEILKKASGPAPVHPASGRPAPDGAGLVDAAKALKLAQAKARRAQPQTAVA